MALQTVINKNKRYVKPRINTSFLTRNSYFSNRYRASNCKNDCYYFHPIDGPDAFCRHYLVSQKEKPNNKYLGDVAPSSKYSVLTKLLVKIVRMHGIYFALATKEIGNRNRKSSIFYPWLKPGVVKKNRRDLSYSKRTFQQIEYFEQHYWLGLYYRTQWSRRQTFKKNADNG